MRFSFHVPRSYKYLGVVLLMLVLTLAGCGGGGSGNGSSSTNNVKFTIGSKNDTDGQLLAEMYYLLLQHNGYNNITLHLALGQNAVLDSAIKSGAVDLYPEFTGTALNTYKLGNIQDPQQAYQKIAAYYEQNFKVTWLTPAYNLNDSYGLCTNDTNAGKYNLSKMSDLVPVAPQLTLAGQQDFLDPTAGIWPPVAQAYGINFKNTVQISEQLGFSAVKNDNAQINECYTTDPTIVVDNFKLLTDDKNAFPGYFPAPIVRDELLSKAPSIKTILNALAPHLTTASQTALIKQVSVDHKSVKEVAQQYLQSIGLL